MDKGASGKPDRAVAASPSSPAVSPVPASIPSARKRNWRGQFVKNLRETPPDSREWLIWSRYHHAWHRRSSDGGACGYTYDIAQAGLFVRAKADEYNDGDRDEAFHVSEKLEVLRSERRQHASALASLNYAIAQAIEARRAETLQAAPSSDESAVPQGCVRNDQ